MLSNCYIHPTDTVSFCCVGFTQKRSAAFIFLDCQNQEGLKVGISSGNTLILLRSTCEQQCCASYVLKAPQRAQKQCVRWSGSLHKQQQQHKFQLPRTSLVEVWVGNIFQRYTTSFGVLMWFLKDLRERKKKTDSAEERQKYCLHAY